MFRYRVASIQFSWVSTASARTSRKQLAAFGKMRTTCVRRFSSSLRRSSMLVDLQVLVVLRRKPVERERLFDVLFDPCHQLRVAAFPLRDPRCQVIARFTEVAPLVDPAQLAQAVVIALARKVVQAIPQKVHVAALPRCLW